MNLRDIDLKNPAVMRLLPLIALLIFSLLLASGLFGNKKPIEGTHVIGIMPGSLEMASLANPPGYFGANLWQNQVVMINVFASWCVPCATEHEVLMRLAKTGKVAIYGIAWKDDPAKTLAWLTEHGNPYQSIGVDTQGKATMSLALTGVPETFVLGRNGKIAYNYKAAITDEMVQKEILPLVERLQANAPTP